VTDLTPPPEQPMDDETRARIRARLADGATEEAEATGLRRWLLPVGAAAAVLLIAFGGTYAAFWPGDDTGAPSPGTGASSRPTSEPSDPPSEAPGEKLSRSPKTRKSQPPTSIPMPGDPGFEIPETTCRKEVAREVRGAEQVVSWPLPDGEVGIWASGDRAALCEDSGGTATVHGARPYPATYPMPKEALEWSTVSYTVGGESRDAYVAGGPLPDEVTGITYLWPDGDAQDAEIATDDAGNRWWSVGHVPTEGPMTGERLNLLRLDPVKVTISLSGVQDHVTLPWGAMHECAQVNHGC